MQNLRMNDEIKSQCYNLSLEGYEQKDIAKRLNISPSMVSRAISSITKGNDYQLAVKSCGMLIERYVRFQDFCNKKIKELAEMEPDDNRDQIAIIRLQAELQKDMLTIGASGDFIQNVRLMRNKLHEIESGPNINQS